MGGFREKVEGGIRTGHPTELAVRIIFLGFQITF